MQPCTLESCMPVTSRTMQSVEQIMKKIYKSSSFARTFDGTRQEAITAACAYFAKVFDTFGEEDAKRYNWRADDGSGFTITCTPRKKLKMPTRIECTSRWNAARV